ncbi:XrtN system VIT domain-containing protein [Fibrella forsythiae]|uniref:XrtN system VIT domain-containing protein n=1 Tax=Fibrella forsythiae TaxID=2817061 RepID=A0ABS3JQP9_9BACT|nr:XrtN system VIT domain-containing protein [Fibrella forsythiae]MBO0952339.1 XrtN system VIT domain-containing protein [Fibrella forsythiae]
MLANRVVENVPEAQARPALLSPAPRTENEALTNWRSPFDDPIFRTASWLLTFSAGLFIAHGPLLNVLTDDGFLFFNLHYIIAFVFSLIVLPRSRFGYLLRNDRRQQASVWLSLVLWYISAFALNRHVAIFEQSAPWLCWIIAGSGALMVLHTWADKLPAWGQQLLYAGLAGAFLLFLYQAIYVGPFYAISVPALLVLGISFHTFVPALLAFVVGRQLVVAVRQRTYLRGAVAAGLLIPVSLLLLFLANWYRTVDRLDQVRMDAALRHTSDLPDWVQMAQQLHSGPVTDRILKEGIVYSTSPWSRSLGGQMGLNDVRIHDPLVVIAHSLFPVPAFAADEQTKLLRAVSQQHYGTERKLWSGSNLTTSQVATQVRVWPQYRLSYTEKTIWVQNSGQWESREALYTFHLPEGSAVSALSLWINGREEPARLTTQAKADSAYKQIVGVESRVAERDPSVVTWQEGNRVTIRVFPVPAKQDRQVKIGITSPLRLNGKTLTYQNPWFEGPSASQAKETLKLTVDGDPANLELNGISGAPVNRELILHGRYQPDWSVQMNAPTLSPEPFQLDGKAYQLASYVPVKQPFTPTDLYLDINETWTSSDVDKLIELADKQHIAHVWVFRDGLVSMTKTNRQQLVESLTKQPFSLFPIYRIAKPETSLFITKGTPNGPTLTDLDSSAFANRLAAQATYLTAPIRTYSLTSELPPYLRTLTELRVLHTVTGDLNNLEQLLTKHQFNADAVTDNQVVIAGSGLVIRQIVADSAGQSRQKANLAPDHLLRLFTYNQLMQRVGRSYFDKTYRADETLAAIAQRGHVVSPVSSLVVLETPKDYDRFGIKADKKGLDNATLNQDGAVPEPHEWAMMVLIALLVGWFYVRPRLLV